MRSCKTSSFGRSKTWTRGTVTVSRTQATQRRHDRPLVRCARCDQVSCRLERSRSDHSRCLRAKLTQLVKDRARHLRRRPRWRRSASAYPPDESLTFGPASTLRPGPRPWAMPLPSTRHTSATASCVGPVGRARNRNGYLSSARTHGLMLPRGYYVPGETFFRSRGDRDGSSLLLLEPSIVFTPHVAFENPP